MADDIVRYDNQKIIDIEINKEVRKAFLDYSMSVIVQRALPDVRDGLKPVHRRILYTMFENNLYPDRAYRKCADTVGAVLGRYHPHGDASVYDAMVRLAQDFSMRYLLVDGHGNFGTVDGDPAAAYRYTESRMSKISMRMLQDIDKETVDFQPNYDDRLKEPTVLPTRFPNLLVNGTSGIAVGMATNIPPHNMKEIVDGVNYLIDHPDCDTAELMQFIKGPDFPTAGIIMGTKGIKEAYSTGQRPIVIITSNAEKELPDAFLRRCVFHYIEFPDQQQMEEILRVHFGRLEDALVRQALAAFYWVRELRQIEKKPSTSELVDWLRALVAGGIAPERITREIPFAGVLLKKDKDLRTLQRELR